MLKDVSPVKMAMFGIHNDPVEPECNRHFRNAGRLQSDPKAVHSLVSRQFFSKPLDRLGLHLRLASGVAGMFGASAPAVELPGVSFFLPR